VHPVALNLCSQQLAGSSLTSFAVLLSALSSRSGLPLEPNTSGPVRGGALIISVSSRGTLTSNPRRSVPLLADRLN
jgi:hypothetical protein